MAVRSIRIWPDPALREVATPVVTFDSNTTALVEDLFETMYQAHGVGLAATQIAVAQRVLVIDLDPHQDAATDPEVQAELATWGFTGPQEFINLKFVKVSGSIIWAEGCLSVPGITDDVERYSHVTIEAQNRNGETFQLEASGLYAVALQHENDHLDGKVFVSYLSKMKRDVIKRKMQRLKCTTTDGVEAAEQLAS